MRAIRRKQNNTKSRRESLYKSIDEKSSNVDVPIDSEENVDFSDILNKKLKVFRVSPLYNFNPAKLKRYEMKMTQELNARRRFNSRVTYTCTFALNDTLRINKNCPEAIKVEVKSDQVKSVYIGYFMSWTETKHEAQGCTFLPLLLAQIKSQEIHNIHLILCKLFDCDIQPVAFSFFGIVTFFVNMLQSPQNSADISQELLTLEYKIPNCKPQDRIKVTLFLQDTTIVLAMVIDSIRENYADVENGEIVLEFYTRVLAHIYNVYHMELTLAELYKIVFPDAYITTDGQLKLGTNEVTLTVLSALQHFSALEDITSKN